MTNLIYDIKNTKRPFVYFHTLLFDSTIMELAQSAGKSLELDISIGPDGELFIGHPLEFYEYKHLDPLHRNLPIDTIIDLADVSNLYLVLDCKDVRALPWIKQIIHAYGAHRVAVHAWVDALLFKPYPAEIIIEPHWKYEDLPLKDVLAVKESTGAPIICSARGLTLSRLLQDNNIFNHILSTARGAIDVINFNLPFAEIPPASMIENLLDNGILTWVDVDKAAAKDLPLTYVGISDHIAITSTVNNDRL